MMFRDEVAVLVLTAWAQFGIGCTQSSTPPAPARTDAGADAARRSVVEQVSIGTRDGWTLAGELRVVEGARAVLLVHQLSSNRSEWAPLLTRLQQGTPLSTLAIDLRGHGASTRSPNGDVTWQTFGADAQRWAGVILDVQAAIQFLQGRTGGRQVLIVGSSIGGSAAIRAAAEDTLRVVGVGLLSPGLSYRGIEIQRAFEGFVRNGGSVFAAAADGDDPAVEALRALRGAMVTDGGAAAAPSTFESELYANTGAHGVSIGGNGAHPELWERLEGWIRRVLRAQR